MPNFILLLVPLIWVTLLGIGLYVTVLLVRALNLLITALEIYIRKNDRRSDRSM